MKKDKFEEGVKCECGYYNLNHNVKIYGTCLKCKKTLDEKAKFKYDMNKKLKLWRGKFK